MYRSIFTYTHTHTILYHIVLSRQIVLMYAAIQREICVHHIHILCMYILCWDGIYNVCGSCDVPWADACHVQQQQQQQQQEQRRVEWMRKAGKARVFVLYVYIIIII